jgi:hypothetical protein
MVLAERTLQRLQEKLEPLGVELNREKTQIADTLKGEAFGFLGFDLRRESKRNGNGHYIKMTPKKMAIKAIKAKIRDIVRHGGATPAKVMVECINAALAPENAVKTQIWTAISIYVFEHIVRKRINLDVSPYTLLQIFSVTLFEKIPLNKDFLDTKYSCENDVFGNQLNLFDS